MVSRNKYGALTAGNLDNNDLMDTPEVASVGSSPSKGGRATSGQSRSVRPAKRAKRVLEGGSPVGNVNMNVDGLNVMREVNDKLRKFLFTESNRVSKAACEFVLKCVNECETQMVRMIAENERLLGRLDECERQLKNREFVRPTGTFASAVRGNVSGGVSVSGSKMVAGMKDRVKEKTYAVVIRANEDGSSMTSDQIKDRVMNGVSDSLNVRVNAVRKTRSGGLAVETASEAELKALKECKKFDVLGLKVESPRKIGPKVVMFDVENDMTNESLMNELYDRNLRRMKVSEDEFRQRVRVVSRTNRKGVNVGNVVVELNRRMHDILMNQRRVYVKWKVCKVRDFVSVMRCRRCLAFGHTTRECALKERLCEKCGENGHLKEKCRNVCRCRNCKLRGRKSDHSVMSRECPEYKRMVERERARIDDG